MFLWLAIVLMISASVSSHEHKLNWVVPPANSSESFNDWASNKRFQVGDTIRFKYKKDSVMQVTKEDYKLCNSSHPRFYSNTGKTRFMFDHSVPYYFISGMSGHCEKGQKMIVEVLSRDKTTTSSAPPAALAVWFCFFSLSLSLVA
ncbi:PREDICTED: early nodulin-like protein 1 [Camelina sativa]|uniref:Early nodulin-like protein 1 n=1 Tax=Camelina sativa TaxID=90675 RepID=A0ABM0VB15_CAMSA|nr:PREDICTED: early nodulin-like protein 1 [Camelina sativa]